MSDDFPSFGPQRPALRFLWLLLCTAAAAFGLYGRFKGLGTWPLGVDEFYLSRSIDNVLRTGLPGFPCGGYYTRGLIYQYAVAGVRLLGGSPEFAGRFVAAGASVLVLPAVFLLGKRVQGSAAGWLVAVLLCVSVWEIEMARFARMYAPFQAVFAWYLLFYVRYTVDRQAAAFRWMVALSAVGVATWEGGALLGIANMFAVVAAHDRGRLKAADWRRLAWLVLLLAAFYVATRDWRGSAEPPMMEGALADAPVTRWQMAAAWFGPWVRHPLWSVGLLLPAVACLEALREIAARPGPLLGRLGLLVVLFAAAVHAFLAALGVLALVLMMRLLDRRAVGLREARYFWLALAAFLLYWAAVFAGAAASDSGAAPASTQSLAALAQHLFGLPDVFGQILRPWARTLPLLSAGLCAAFLYLCAISLAADRRTADPVSVLLSLAILLLLAVGSAPTDRVETRYTFFLYPLLMVLAVSAVFIAASRHRLAGGGWQVPALAVLLLFGLAGDFKIRHVLEIDSARINFRAGMSRVDADHFYPRNEIKSVADWLAAHVAPGDLVIAGIPSLDEYFPSFDYFFLEEDDDRYESYVCADDKTERWTNHTVLYTLRALSPLVAAGHRVYANVYGPAERHLMAAAAGAGWSVTRVFRADYGTSDVLLIQTLAPAASR